MAVSTTTFQVHQARGHEFYGAEIQLDPTDSNLNTIIVNRGPGLRRLSVVVNPATNLYPQITAAIASATR